MENNRSPEERLERARKLAADIRTYGRGSGWWSRRYLEDWDREFTEIFGVPPINGVNQIKDQIKRRIDVTNSLPDQQLALKSMLDWIEKNVADEREGTL